MSVENRYLEENTARLIRAAYGPDARPSPRASQQTFRLLLRSQRAQSPVADFPDAAVGICGGVVLVLAAWLAVRVLLHGVSALVEPSLLIATIWLALNLASMPIASMIILKRRHNG